MVPRRGVRRVLTPLQWVGSPAGRNVDVLGMLVAQATERFCGVARWIRPGTKPGDYRGCRKYTGMLPLNHGNPIWRRCRMAGVGRIAFLRFWQRQDPMLISVALSLSHLAEVIVAPSNGAGVLRRV